MLKQLSFTYFLICILATIGLSFYSIYRYVVNEDVTVVKETTFLSTKDAIYPSFSFCILPPFLKNKLDVFDDISINMTSYIKFLEGELWDDRFLRVEYDNVTVSLSDNLINAKYSAHSYINYDWNLDHYVSFRSAKRKCFTINAPFLENNLFRKFDLRIKKEIFPDGERSTANKIYTYLHYPGQRFTAYYTIKNRFDPRHDKKNYDMIFRVRNVGVVTRRNKRQDPCVEEWRYYDQHFMEHKMNQVGCHPPHWKTISNLPTCSDATQMKLLSKQPSTFEISSFRPPCKVINRLDYIYQEVDLNYQG